MNRAQIRKGLILISVASMFVLGCELIVDFDRTKIPVESTETGPPGDATLPDVVTDAPDEAAADGGDADAPTTGDADASDAAADG